jgi:hypothetical protein
MEHQDQHLADGLLVVVVVLPQGLTVRVLAGPGVLVVEGQVLILLQHLLVVWVHRTAVVVGMQILAVVEVLVI